MDAGTKVESVEAAPSQPDLAGEAPPKGKVKKKRTKETFPTPDRKPSSEYYYSSASEADDDDSQNQWQLCLFIFGHHICVPLRDPDLASSYLLHT